MPIKEIPKAARSGLAILRRLPDQTVDQVYAGLVGCGTPMEMGPQAMARCIEAGTPSLDRGEIASLAEALASLYGYSAYSDTEAAAVVGEVLAAMATASIDELRIAPEEEPLFRSRLERLLSVQEVANGFKAAALSIDCPRMLTAVKIITDLRPVFGKEPTKEPTGAVLVNTLSLHYFEGGRHREFSVALDADDLKKLKSAAERAEKKAESLAGLMRRAGIHYFEEK